jgi:hypothetical protein
MGKDRIAHSGIVIGSICALAWYLVFGLGVLFHLDYPAHIFWGRVTIAAAISFVVGWGTMQVIRRPRSEGTDRD